jgi:TolA-binding protein
MNPLGRALLGLKREELAGGALREDAQQMAHYTVTEGDQNGGSPMLARVAFAAILPLLFFSPAAISEEAPRGPENAANGPADGGAASKADTAEREMKIGHYYLSKKNYISAINRFKVVVTRFPSSPFVDEALFWLVQAYLTLGVDNEAQAAAVVLNRKFPDSHWRSDALDMLKVKGLEPAEDEKSWICKILRACR